MKIYFSEDTELTELEIELKCCRLDVLVEIDGNYYHPYIFMPISLLQDIECYEQNGEIYLNDACMIIVKAVDKQSIIDAILYHYKHKFFDAFVPIDINKNLSFYSAPYTELSNWVLVYDSEKQ